MTLALNRAECKKLLKYQYMKKDLRTIWELKGIATIPVLVGATGLIKPNLQKYLESVPGYPTCDEVQLAALMGTISIIKRALNHTEL